MRHSRIMSRLGFTIATSLIAASLNAEMVITNGTLSVHVAPERNGFVVRYGEADRHCVTRCELAHAITEMSTRAVSDPIWGEGQELLLRHDNRWTTSLRLYSGVPFVHAHTTIHNGESTPYMTSAEELIRIHPDLGVELNRLKAYGTGGLHRPHDAPGSFTFAAVVDPPSRNGIVTAWLTHQRSSGVFFTDVQEGQVQVTARLDFGRFQVAPGQSRETETLLIGYFDDARLGLEAYADAVARQYAIQLPPQPSVYCTWYHAGASDEERLLQNAAFAREHLKPFGFSVVQIDDKWQKRLPQGVTYDGSIDDLKDGGPVKVFVEANERFPSGMSHVAEQIDQMGLVPGIWFMPFVGNWKNPFFADRQNLFARTTDGKPFTTRWSGTCLDLTHPETQEFVRQRVRRITDWGYRYFKLDGMHTGAVCHNVYVNTGYSEGGRWPNQKDFGGGVLHDPAMTHIQAYRQGLQIVRDTAGPDVFILGCNVSQNMRCMGAAFGLIDAMRIGPDNGGAGQGRWNHIMVGPYHGTNLYFLNRRVWHNDPDPVYVRPSNPLASARLMVSWVAVSGSMLSASYQFAELAPERLDLLKRCMPGHQAEARPVDLFDTENPSIWLVSDVTGGVARHVIGLFNWQENDSKEIHYDLNRIGLDSETTYVGFDFWENDWTGPIRAALKLRLAPGSCRVLSVRPRADHPQLVSTSRHILQGMIDVFKERWSGDDRTLVGTSRVVGGDPYELRIALPETGTWYPSRVAASGASITTRRVTQSEVRVLIESPTSQDVRWSVKF